jgi:DNA-binding response OmpR family regulator
MGHFVLVVDDEDVIGVTLEYIVNRKSNGEFIAVHTTTLDDAFLVANAIKPDLVLLDVRMPGARGLEPAIKFRDKMGLKVLLMTGWPGVAELLADLEAEGGVPFPIIPKPYRPENLLDLIRKLLGASMAASAGAGQH